MFPESSDPKLRHLMECSFGAACLEIDVASMLEYGKAAETMMALRIMTTVAAGERDPGRLKDLALQAVDGRQIDEPPQPTKSHYRDDWAVSGVMAADRLSLDRWPAS